MVNPGGGTTHIARPAQKADVDTLCAVLVRAFMDDPVTSYIFPSERRRPRGLYAYFKLQIKSDYLPYGGVFTTEARNGAAVWAPPGKPLLHGISGLAKLMPVAPHVMGNLSRTIRLLSLVEAKHPKEPHWYLATLGTDPIAQGQGVGSTLMAPALERCDRDGVGAYLESSKESNVSFYARHGFVVREVLQPEGGPRLWAMWRDPRPPS